MAIICYINTFRDYNRAVLLKHTRIAIKTPRITIKILSVQSS